MSRLILHVGPGKCGSTSIQTFFKKNKRPCKQKTNFFEIPPAVINEINIDQVDQNYFTSFKKTYLKKLRFCDVLIISHEYLFQCPLAIKNICDVFKDKVSEVTIIGYSRRQSNFLYSAYSQWFFRAKERIIEVNNQIKTAEINPNHFSGLEKFIIAAILSDFYTARHFTNKIIFNWNKGYSDIENYCKDATIRSDSLPKRDSSKNLIENFCTKAELELLNGFKEISSTHENTSFNSNLVEAINIAIELDFQVTSPDLDNELLIDISNSMKDEKINSPFVLYLGSFIDYYYLSENQSFCSKFNIDPSYFRTNTAPSKEEIIQKIREESEKRQIENTNDEKKKRLVAEITASFVTLLKK